MVGNGRTATDLARSICPAAASSGVSAGRRLLGPQMSTTARVDDERRSCAADPALGRRIKHRRCDRPRAPYPPFGAKGPPPAQRCRTDAFRLGDGLVMRRPQMIDATRDRVT
jgi:hypothetical protein